MRSVCISSAILVGGIALAVSAAQAQELEVKGGSTRVIDAQSNTTTASDKIAVYGYSVPVAFWGIGGYFTGGYHGVRGYANTPGSGSRAGGYFVGGNGTSSNWGIYASAYGPTGSTNYAGYFNGNVFVNGTITQSSDEHLKLNIKDLGGAIDKVRHLKPRTYDFRRDTAAGKALPEGKQIGFLAQELREVFPEMVKEAPVFDSADGTQKATESGKVLTVNYIEMIPVLVKAVQEQQAQIDELKAKVARLEGKF